MCELNVAEEKLLTELIQHPGWGCLLKVLRINQSNLLDLLYSTPDNNQHIVNTWRALESVLRTCENASNAADVVKLGIENVSEY